MRRALAAVATALPVLMALMIAAPATGEVPSSVLFQGYLQDANGTPVTDAMDFIIDLYDWEEEGNLIQSFEMPGIDVVDGTFHVQLPIVAEDVAVDELWLEVQFRPANQPDDQWKTIKPRLQVISVPYALTSEHAQTAASLSGFDPALYATSEWVGGNYCQSPCYGDGDVEVLLGGKEFCQTCYTDSDVEALLGGKEFCQTCYTDSDVEALLGGKEFCQTCYTDSDVEALLGGKEFCQTCYTDSDVEALLGGKEFCQTCYTDGDVEAILDNKGYVFAGDLATVATSGNFTDLIGVPDDLADGDQDTVTTSLPWSAITDVPEGFGESIPQGGIIMWSGPIASIPDGWALCDGTNGTPNLLDRFIASVETAEKDPGETGGENVQSLVHNHSYSGSTSSVGNSGCGACANPYYPPNYSGAHSHSYSGTTGNGELTNVDLRPSYYQLAFIMKL